MLLGPVRTGRGLWLGACKLLHSFPIETKQGTTTILFYSSLYHPFFSCSPLINFKNIVLFSQKHRMLQEQIEKSTIFPFPKSFPSIPYAFLRLLGYCQWRISLTQVRAALSFNIPSKQANQVPKYLNVISYLFCRCFSFMDTGGHPAMKVLSSTTGGKTIIRHGLTDGPLVPLAECVLR